MSRIRIQFEQARDRAAALAAQADRTEVEDQEMVDQLDRAESLKVDLEEAEARDARIAALGEVSRAITLPGAPAMVKESPALTAGEYFSLTAKMLNGEISEGAFMDRAGRYVDALKDRAYTGGKTSDVPGILPEPIVGPIIDFYDGTRPVFASFRSMPMPQAGKVFERPKVTQHVVVGEQAAEGDDLPTQKFTVGSDSVTKRTLGGTLDISRQMQDWTDPSALQLIVEDFARVYARYTETLAIAHLVALSTGSSPWVATNTATITKSFVDGVLAVGNALDNDSGSLTLWMDTASMAALAAPTGSTDRTTIAVVREALESIDQSLNIVVSRRLPANTRILGDASMVESYEQLHGLLTMEKPTNLTTSISYSGYVAFAGTAAGFVKVKV